VIYLDHRASTPLDLRVREAMLPWLAAEAAANPHAARHRPGWQAAAAVDTAQAEIAHLIGARPGEILFTSGATEANNLALLGAVPAGWRVIVSAIEHASVLACLPILAARGHAVEILTVDRDGLVDLDRLAELLGAGPAFVSIMSANNEIGTIQPLGPIAERCRQAGAILHVDAVQSLATAEIAVAELGIDLMSLSGHKLYGPQGIGALYVRDGIAVTPQLHGGGQQAGRRAGTVPVALAVGLGAACACARQERAADAARLTRLRELLWQALAAAIPAIRRNSPAGRSLPGCLHVTIPGIDAADLLLDLPDLALSTGAACSTDSGEPSHVLLATGRTPEDAAASLRFGLGRATTAGEIDAAAALLTAAVNSQR
jgi:cysteine desulfurase